MGIGNEIYGWRLGVLDCKWAYICTGSLNSLKAGLE